MPSPRDSGLTLAHPPLKRWAFLYRLAARDWLLVPSAPGSPFCWANLGYAFRENAVVEIESEWTGRKREKMGMPLRVKVRELPHPSNPGLEPALSAVEGWGTPEVLGWATRPLYGSGTGKGD